MTVAVLLGLGSAACWGVADFLGGLQSRRLPVLRVLLWSQLAGAALAGLLLLAAGPPPAWGSVAWGAAGGAVGAIALGLFYKGLAVGAMSIVAPVSACGAVVPVAVALARGEVPPPLSWVGMATALLGVVLVSRAAGGGAGRAGASPRLAVGLALGAALGFGGFFTLVDQGGAAGSPLWTLGGVRAASASLLLLAALALRHPVPWPGRSAPPVAAAGILDTLANALFIFAATAGHAGVVAVLSSLYPVVTVLLARLVLGERLSGEQAVGAAAALVGVTLLAAA